MLWRALGSFLWVSWSGTRARSLQAAASVPHLIGFRSVPAFCFSSGVGVHCLWDSFSKFSYMLGPKERKIEQLKQ